MLNIGDQVLVHNVGLRGKHKLANKWEEEIYEVRDQPNVDIPVYVVFPLGKPKHTRTLHRNLLLPVSSLPIDDAAAVTEGKTDPPVPNDETDDSEQEENILINVPNDTVTVNVSQDIDVPEQDEPVPNTPDQNDDNDSSDSFHLKLETDSDSSYATSDTNDAAITNDALPKRPTRTRKLPARLQSGDYVLYRCI